MATKALFQSASNTATNGTAIGATEQDIMVKKVIVGAPVSTGNIWLYNISNPLGSSAANIAVKLTFPSFSTTNLNMGPQVFDFTGGDPQGGLRLPEGGNIQIDQTMQVTVIYDDNVG